MPANTLARSLRRGEVLELLTKQEIEVPAGLELRIGAGFGRNGKASGAHQEDGSLTFYRVLSNQVR